MPFLRLFLTASPAPSSKAKAAAIAAARDAIRPPLRHLYCANRSMICEVYPHHDDCLTKDKDKLA
jgi:hypothetical protein